MRWLGLRYRIVAAVVLVTLAATVAMAFTAYKLQEDDIKARFVRAAQAGFQADAYQVDNVVRAHQATPLAAVERYMAGEAGSAWTAIILARLPELTTRVADGEIKLGAPDLDLLVGSRYTNIPLSLLTWPWPTRHEQEIGSSYVISQPVGDKSVLLVEYYDLQPMRDDLAVMRLQLAAVASVVALLGVAAALVAAGRIHRPVRQVAKAAQSVGNGALDVRVPARGGDDLANLANSFNSMATRLQEKDEQQRRFASDIAHDLRTPISSIVAAADSLANDSPAVRERSAELIRTQSRRLAKLVEDLLEISAFDAGVLVLRPERVEVPELLADAIELTAPDAEIVVRVQGDTAIQADPRRLHTVVRNLLTNAVDHGGEPITATVDGLHPDVVTITIADSGPGIPADLQPILFDRFTRGDLARRPSEGSGLGLAIARENVLLHHGQISMSNANGAIFTVTLPR